MKHSKLLMMLPLLLGSSALVSCGGGLTSASSEASTSTAPSTSTSTGGGFSFIAPETSTVSASPSVSTSVELDIEVMATIDKDGDYTVEAEDCDTSGCTLQTGCSSFFEIPGEQYPTSGGECIACISAPSILAYRIDCKDESDITFYTVSAKYENPWDLDANVQYYLDEGEPFVTGYTSFGRGESNDWYNWKTVKLGTIHVDAGVHQFNIKVNSAFPNTDCFKLSVSNYGVTNEA